LEDHAAEVLDDRVGADPFVPWMFMFSGIFRRALEPYFSKVLFTLIRDPSRPSPVFLAFHDLRESPVRAALRVEIL
jgi:hypothetical protein